MNAILKKIRDITPLSWRIRIGPHVAHMSYLINLHLRNHLPRPKILSLRETIERVRDHKLSVIRFGDGEMSAIENYDLGFQSKDPVMAARLKEILQTNDPSLLICVLNIFGKMDFLTKKAFRFELHHLFKHGSTWRKLLSQRQTYGDAFITRPYLMMRDKSESGDLFKMLFSLWESKDLILVEGSKSRIGVGNDMFDRARSVRRILCPATNAFARYDDIKKATEKIASENPNSIIILSVGPTAKVLAFDLWKNGHRVLDIGHIDMEYEMFLRSSPELVKVPYKYFSEIGARDPEDCTDPLYLSQIVTRIS